MVTAAQLILTQSPISALIRHAGTIVTTKLDDSNYMTWKFQMELLLVGYGILGFVDGSHPCPPQFVIGHDGDTKRISVDYEIWTMHDRAIMPLIVATISSTAMLCLIGSTTSREIWLRLQERFDLVTHTSIFQMKIDRLNIQKDDNTISQYLRRINEAKDHLFAVGVHKSDEDAVIVALNGLHAEYSTFKTVIRGTYAVFSFKKFQSQLLAEEARIKHKCQNIPYCSAMMANNVPFGEFFSGMMPGSSSCMSTMSFSYANGGQIGMPTMSYAQNQASNSPFFQQALPVSMTASMPVSIPVQAPSSSMAHKMFSGIQQVHTLPSGMPQTLYQTPNMHQVSYVHNSLPSMPSVMNDMHFGTSQMLHMSANMSTRDELSNIQHLKHELQKNQKELEVSSSSVVELNATVSSLTSDKDNSTREFDAIQKECSNLRTSSERKAALDAKTLGEKEEELQQLKKKLEFVLIDTSRNNEIIDDLTRENENLRAMLDIELQNEKNLKHELQIILEDLGKSRNDVSTLENQLKESKNSYTELEAAISKVQAHFVGVRESLQNSFEEATLRCDVVASEDVHVLNTGDAISVKVSTTVPGYAAAVVAESLPKSTRFVPRSFFAQEFKVLPVRGILIILALAPQCDWKLHPPDVYFVGSFSVSF